MRIFVCLLSLTLGACALDVVTGVTEAIHRPYPCQEGQVDGPGVIGGLRLNSGSPLGKGTIFIQQQRSASEEGGTRCTGSLIGENMMLTAAHCVESGYGEDAEAITTLVFDSDPLCSLTKGKAERIRAVEKITIHPGYRGTKASASDVALVRFTGRAPEGARVLKVADDYLLDATETVYAAGFGRTVDWNQPNSQVPYLRLAHIKPESALSFTFGVANGKKSPTLLFRQDEGEAVCQGDSGGPAGILREGQLQVIGVASYVDSLVGATCTSHVVYTNVDYYRDWLALTYDQMADGESSENPFKASLTH